MRVQSTTSNFITFRAISLNEREKAKSDKLISELNTARNKEQVKSNLLKVFDKHIQNEATQKAGGLYYREDVLQKMYLEFLEIIESGKQFTTETLINVLNTMKPDKNEIKEVHQFGRSSLNERIRNDSKQTIEDKITYDKLPVYLRPATDKEREKYLKKIEELVDKAELTEREKKFLKEKISGKTFKQIAKEYDRGETLTQRIVHNAIAKIQDKSGVLPEMYNDFAEALISKYELNIPKDDIKKVLLNNTHLLAYPQDTLLQNTDEIAKLLVIDTKSCAKIAIKRPQLFYTKPETLKNTITKTAMLLGTDIKAYIKAGLRRPTIFTQKPETIVKNIKEASMLFKIEPEIYTYAALRQPILFAQKPQTALKNITRTSMLLKIEPMNFINAALKTPQLFSQKPETIAKNIVEGAKLLNIEPEIYTKAALRQPPIFVLKPTTIAESIKRTANLLEIEPKNFIKTALKYPQLFCLKPESIVKKVRIIQYYNKIQNKNFNKITTSLQADSYLYEKILTYLVKKADGLRSIINRKEFREYLRKNSKTYHLEIPDNELAKEFIRFAEEFAEKNLGKQIFYFKIKK